MKLGLSMGRILGFGRCFWMWSILRTRSNLCARGGFRVWSALRLRLAFVPRGVLYPDAAYSQDAAHSPSPVQPVDGAHRCALLECYAPRCQVEERCSPAEQVAFWLGAELPHSCLQVYRVLLLVWLAHRD
jgi:hypothetical protein